MTVQYEITAHAIARTCARLVLDALPRTAAFHALELETAARIERSLERDTHEDVAAQIKAALHMSKVLLPRVIAAQVRFSVTRTADHLELTRQKNIGPHADHSNGPSIISVAAPDALPSADLLTALGFVTYESLPQHLVTPGIKPTATPRNDMHAIQGMLILMGQAAGLDFSLVQIASIGGLLEFWRQGYDRTGGVEFVASTSEILDFLDGIDIVDILRGTTVEAHDASVMLFSAADLPLPVLAFVGSRGYNKAVGESVVEALGLAGIGEISGERLLERPEAPSSTDPYNASESDGTND